MSPVRRVRYPSPQHSRTPSSGSSDPRRSCVCCRPVRAVGSLRTMPYGRMAGCGGSARAPGWVRSGSPGRRPLSYVSLARRMDQDPGGPRSRTVPHRKGLVARAVVGCSCGAGISPPALARAQTSISVIRVTNTSGLLAPLPHQPNGPRDRRRSGGGHGGHLIVGDQIPVRGGPRAWKHRCGATHLYVADRGSTTTWHPARTMGGSSSS